MQAGDAREISSVGSHGLLGYARTLAAGLLLVASVARATDGASELIQRVADTAPLPRDQAFTKLFQPFRTESIALSPDGLHIAYTVREGDTLNLVVVAADDPGALKMVVRLLSDAEATAGLDIRTQEPTPARVRWMRWTTPTRLVIDANRMIQTHINPTAGGALQLQSGWIGCPGIIATFDIDGKSSILVTPLQVAFTVYDAESIVGARSLRRTWNPSMPVGDNLWSDSSAIERVPLEGDAHGFATWDIPRAPTVIGFLPGDRRAVLVLAEGIDRVETFRLDLDTGALKSIDEIRPSLNMVPLFDRQGHMRVRIPATTREPFPHVFSLLPTGRRAQWKKPSEILPSVLADGFSVSPDNYFGQRAVPLGFSTDGHTLYFASNLGRETYGIYGFDLTTKTQTDLTVEHPGFDLYEPRAGVYPDWVQSMPPHFDIRGEFSTNIPSSELLPGSAAQQRMDEFEAQHMLAATVSVFAEALNRAREQVSVDDPSPLVFDPYTQELVGVRFASSRIATVWLRDEMQLVQAILERSYPGKSVEIRDWDELHNRFLALVHGPSDPGAFCLFDLGTKKLVEFVKRAPWLSEQQACRAVPFEFDAEDGRHLAGLLTLPRVVRVPTARTMPVIVLYPSTPWQRIRPEFNPEVQALAQMGAAVLQVNARGTWGMGLQHRAPVPEGFARAQADDVLAAIDHLAPRFRLNPRRVAVVGEGLGGHFALRAVQEHPDRFRCVAVTQAPTSLRAWRDEQRWANIAQPMLVQSFLAGASDDGGEELHDHPETFTRPVCAFAFRGDDSHPKQQAYPEGRSLVSAVRSRGLPAEFADIELAYLRRLPKARAAVFDQIDEFFTANLYDYKVEAGQTYILEEN